jgi:hypothetical protein
MDSSKARDPFFGFRSELRGIAFDPTSFLMFTLDTSDLSDGKPKILGHAVMPLFLNADDKNP